MGEVYKARDTRLDRIVAIKVLPETLAADPQFRERFEREARAISQLTHPHICTLHDIGRQDLTDFLVMEYLEGETLADRLVKGALPLDQALTIAIQIASALDTAHRAGIVHRDLKPGNIILTRSGGASAAPIAKLLDFGLAKASAPAVAGAGLSMLPTTPPGLTAQGTILGTFQYMAPEQIEGQEADARTDIFAFGAVLYEMLTGKKAFEAKSHASLIAAIMSADPKPISALQPLTPAALDHLVTTCLAKDPNDRWQSAGDLARELKWITETGMQAVASNTAAQVVRRPGRRERVAWTVAVLCAAAAVVIGMLYLRRVPDTDAVSIRFAVAPPQNATLATGVAQLTIPALSPDGRRLAFVANRAGTNALWVRSVDTLDARPLAGTDGAVFPFWSPDGRALGFITEGRTLKTIDASGGPVRTLCTDCTGGGAARGGVANGGTWSPDGVIVFGSQSAGLFTVSSNGGAPTPLTAPSAARGEAAHRWPSFLPDGRHFLYWATPSSTIWLGSLDSKETTRLLMTESQAVYVAPGSLLFVRQGTLLAQSFDARRATLTGKAVPIAEQVLPDPTGAAAFAASSNGVLAYRTGTLGVTTQLTWVDRVGKPLGPVGQPGSYRNPALSPDGTRVAVEAVDSQRRTQDLWLMELARGVTSRFTFDPANDIYPVWSPDGKQIMFGSDRGGVFNLYQKRADGVGNEEPVFKSSPGMAPYSWSPDGRFLVYRAAGSPFNLGILSFVSGRPEPAEGLTPRLYEPSGSTQSFGQVSSDGRWLTYASGESGRIEVYVQSFPAPGGGKWQISKDGGSFPRWRRDGRELFYASDGQLMAVPLTGAPGLEVGAAVSLFEARLLFAGGGPGFRHQYDVAGDGQRFLLNMPIDEATAPSITVVVNWMAELNK